LKKNTGALPFTLILCIALLALASLAGCGGQAEQQEQVPPDQVIRDYYSALRARDAYTAYQYISSRDQENYPLEEFESALAGRTAEDDRDFTTGEVVIEDNLARVPFYPGGVIDPETAATFYLVNEDGQWKISLEMTFEHLYDQ
jgi:hypothetical protein